MFFNSKKKAMMLELQQLKPKLEATKSELQAIKTKYEIMEGDFKPTKAELIRLQSENESVKSEKDSLTSELAGTGLRRPPRRKTGAVGRRTESRQRGSRHRAPRAWLRPTEDPKWSDSRAAPRGPSGPGFAQAPSSRGSKNDIKNM